jgi:hypothetical protein
MTLPTAPETVKAANWPFFRLNWKLYLNIFAKEHKMKVTQKSIWARYTERSLPAQCKSGAT